MSEEDGDGDGEVRVLVARLFLLSFPHLLILFLIYKQFRIVREALTWIDLNICEKSDEFFF